MVSADKSMFSILGQVEHKTKRARLEKSVHVIKRKIIEISKIEINNIWDGSIYVLIVRMRVEFRNVLQLIFAVNVLCLFFTTRVLNKVKILNLYRKNP